jgi:hypothetical protein
MLWNCRKLSLVLAFSREIEPVGNVMYMDRERDIYYKVWTHAITKTDKSLAPQDGE